MSKTVTAVTDDTGKDVFPPSQNLEKSLKIEGNTNTLFPVTGVTGVTGNPIKRSQNID